MARLATVTAVSRRAASARSTSDGTASRSFQEKPQGDGGWINGGFFVLSPEVLDYIDGDDTIWEQEPLERLAARRPADGVRSTTASGSRWTRCATSIHLEELWAERHGAVEGLVS